MNNEPMRAPAWWTDDCQGKKDYDGNAVVISTRYWPRSGGFSDFVVQDGVLVPLPPTDRPASATAHIYLQWRHSDDPEDYRFEPMIERSFEGETFEEVRDSVEPWVQEQYERIVRAIRSEFASQA